MLDPSRSCSGLQSLLPPAVAGRVASQLHLRPLLLDPGVFPPAATPAENSRVMSSPDLESSLRGPCASPNRLRTLTHMPGAWLSSPVVCSPSAHTSGEFTSRKRTPAAGLSAPSLPGKPLACGLAAGGTSLCATSPLPDSRRKTRLFGLVWQRRRPLRSKRPEACSPEMVAAGFPPLSAFPRRGLPTPLRSTSAVFRDLGGFPLSEPSDVFQPVTLLGFGLR